MRPKSCKNWSQNPFEADLLSVSNFASYLESHLPHFWVPFWSLWSLGCPKGCPGAPFFTLSGYVFVCCWKVSFLTRFFTDFGCPGSAKYAENHVRSFKNRMLAHRRWDPKSDTFWIHFGVLWGAFLGLGMSWGLWLTRFRVASRYLAGWLPEGWPMVAYGWPRGAKGSGRPG